MKQLTVLIFLFSFLAVQAQVDQRGIGQVSAAATKTGNTYAIVIGLSKYKEVTSLRFADKDATVFSQYLLSKTGMGLDSANVKVFLNETATLKNIGDAISDIIVKKISKGDKVIFFFAGHGDYDANFMKNQALLLLYGSPKQNYFQNVFGADFISTAQLNDYFINPISEKGAEVLLIVDACHATGVDKALSGGAEGGRVTALALQNIPSAVKMYSCQANQFSLESEQWGGGRGLFSYVLLEGLYGLADADSNKEVSMRELQRYLEDKVPVMAKPNRQDPVVKADDATETIAKVNDGFMKDYLAARDKGITFLASASIKGSEDFILREMDSAQRKLFEECNELINQKNLDSAYSKYLLLYKLDSTNDAVVQLQRNLSAAYQQKAADILLPMQEDVYNFKCSAAELKHAREDMVKAATLLGEHHFLYRNLQGRVLFMQALEIKITKDSARFKQAADLLEQSSLLDPNAPYTYYYLGYFYRNNDKEKARINYQKYLDLMPNSCWANNNLGFVYLELKKYDDAIRSINKALEIKPDYHNAWNNLGNVYYNMQNYNEAIDKYKKAISIKPDYTTAINNLANAYHETGSFDSAIVYLEKLVSLKPDLTYSYYALAQLYSQKKNFPLAFEKLEKALQLKSVKLVELSGDVEIDNLRQMPAFKTLLQKYFSKKELEKYPQMFVPVNSN